LSPFISALIGQLINEPLTKKWLYKVKIDLNPLLDSLLKNPKYLAFNLFQPIDSFVA